LGRKKRGFQVFSAAIALGERERGLRGVFFSHLSPFKTFCYIERSNTIFISRSGASKGRGNRRGNLQSEIPEISFERSGEISGIYLVYLRFCVW